jgi:CheY-like chemotaxis protein
MPIVLLAVDDESATLNLLQLFIEIDRPEWVFYGALDGEQALAVAEQHPIDLVLLDISMPGMDGIEVCKRLRAMSETASIPIVMLTALDTPARREQSFAAGATEFWVKPFSPGDLVAGIERLISSH